MHGRDRSTKFVKFFLLGLWGGFLVLPSFLHAADKPNVIVIFTDDHGYADLSCQGMVEDIRTPNIDKLAKGGVRMTSGYVTAPQCVPSRGGLLTGKYQNRFGLEANKLPLDGFDQEQTLADRLKEADYATGMIGKWHLGPSAYIVRHGFDDVFYQDGSWANFDVEGNDVPPGRKKPTLYHIDAGSQAACAFIDRHHEEPFFLYLAYRAPHVPLDATQKYLKRFPGEMPERRRKALAMISAVDDGVGQILASLQQYEIEENTLIFFIGDNGAPLKIHKEDAPGGGPGWDGSLNTPMNGEKGMLTEGGIRVPFVVYWKGTIPAGQVYEHPVISLDVAATAVSSAGLPEDSELDGVNLLPYLKGENKAAPHDHLVWRWVAQSAIRQGKWKYLQGGERDYLFDLSVDPEETKNLIGEQPELAGQLRDLLKEETQRFDPPGLATDEMSQVWELYFDFYLDGKPAPPLKPQTRVRRRNKQ
ncbi:Aryl-sulfate sulfohydrolase [Planctomycetales bacterium 10988]|nr:Aryl-sulfate sulfohydrolase [Planctomycetales bacterium 10988]